MTLLVANLPPLALEVDLLELFEEYGQVKAVRLVSNCEKGIRGFGIVEMSSISDEKIAYTSLNGSRWMGSILQIREVSILEYILHK